MNLKTYLSERKRRTDNRKFEDGYGWACSQYFLRNEDIDAILLWAYADTEDHPFDEGIKEAVAMIKQLIANKKVK